MEHWEEYKKLPNKLQLKQTDNFKNYGIHIILILIKLKYLEKRVILKDIKIAMDQPTNFQG